MIFCLVYILGVMVTATAIAIYEKLQPKQEPDWEQWCSMYVSVTIFWPAFLPLGVCYFACDKLSDVIVEAIKNRSTK